MVNGAEIIYLTHYKRDQTGTTQIFMYVYMYRGRNKRNRTATASSWVALYLCATIIVQACNKGKFHIDARTTRL